LAGEPGRTYQIEGSTNLADWMAVTQMTTVSGTNQFTDPSATNLGFRFYRAVLAP